jgi:hypothetical protein
VSGVRLLGEMLAGVSFRSIAASLPLSLTRGYGLRAREGSASPEAEPGGADTRLRCAGGGGRICAIAGDCERALLNDRSACWCCCCASCCSCCCRSSKNWTSEAILGGIVRNMVQSRCSSVGGLVCLLIAACCWCCLQPIASSSS